MRHLATLNSFVSRSQGSIIPHRVQPHSRESNQGCSLFRRPTSFRKCTCCIPRGLRTSRPLFARRGAVRRFMNTQIKKHYLCASSWQTWTTPAPPSLPSPSGRAIDARRRPRVHIRGWERTEGERRGRYGGGRVQWEARICVIVSG